METFKQFPKDKSCIICNTNKNKECVLIPIAWTRDWNLAECTCVHKDCMIEWISKTFYYKNVNLFAFVNN